MKKRPDAIIYFISLAVSLVFFVLGNLIARPLPLTDQQKAAFSALCTVAPLLFGHYIAVHRRLDDALSAIDRIPKLSALKVFSSSEDAIRYITSRLPLAKRFFNTRLPPKVVDEYPQSQAYEEYQSQIKECLLEGLEIREILGTAFARHSEELSTLAQGNRSSYTGQLIDQPTHAFINFTVLEYSVDEREVIFGWAISQMPGFPDTCFATTERRMTDFFLAMFQDLWASSKSVSTWSK